MKQFVWFLVVCIYSILNVTSKEDSLADRSQQLTELSLKKPIIRLNNERFKHFVRNPPRNYSVIVMFTALSPQRQCVVCKPAHDEYQIVAQSYRQSRAFSDRVFFGMVDFDDGAEIFQSLKLTTAPVFIHFPAKGKPKKGDQMDLNRLGFSAEHLVKWIQDRTELKIEIIRPPNYSGFLLVAFSIITIGTLLYIKRDSLSFVYNHIVWGVFVILALLICISGQVWNSIRGAAFGVVCYFISGQTWNLINSPPFVSSRKNGMGIFADDSNMQYIAETYIGLFSGSSGHQFIAETYVVFLLYFGVCVGMIMLNEAPKLRSRTGKPKTLLAVVGILTVILLFSFLLSIFRSKYQGYPYSFLIK